MFEIYEKIIRPRRSFDKGYKHSSPDVYKKYELNVTDFGTLKKKSLM
jgi:hypothetical protein